jgi:hypothetical protein
VETNLSFGSVSPPWWKGETVYLIGGGPSLKGFDLERLRGRVTVAVNDAAKYAPWATALFSLDRMWIQERQGLISDFAGEVYLAVAEDFPFDRQAIPGVTYLVRQRSLVGLSDDLGRIYMGGGNSGFGAFNLAYLKRASRIILLGYDCRDAGEHWHEGYEWNRRNGSVHNPLYRKWADQFAHCIPALQRAKVSVYNANLASTIRCFPKLVLEEVI